MNLKFDITCPHCDQDFEEQASNMKPGNSRTCPLCRKVIQYTGDDLSKVERDINRSIDELGKAFKDVGG